MPSDVRPIATTTLGASGPVVSRLGLGLAALGRPAYITLGRRGDLPGRRTPAAMYARTAAVLDAARAAGVRYLDAARSYGRAEEFLARWLREREMPADTLTIGSKWGYRYTAGWRVDAPRHEEKDLTLAHFARQLDETRALLGDRLALYQIHSATVESGCLTDEPLLRALVTARRAGAFRLIGVTLSGAASADALAQAVGARAHGERVFDVVQATFNCLEPSLAGSLAGARAEGLGVIVKEALANGRLTEANTRPEDAALLRTLRTAAQVRGCSIDQLALAFVLEQPWVDVVLSGAATVPHLRSHLAAFEVDLDAFARAALGSVAEPLAAYWTTRAALPWT